jgi:hypothetical protein
MPMSEETVVVEESVENTESTETSTEEVVPEFKPFEYSFDKETKTVTTEEELRELVEMGEYHRTKGKAGDDWLKSYAKENNMSKSELLEAFKQQKIDNEVQAIAEEETVSIEIAKRLRNEKLLTEKDMTNAQKASEKKRQDEQMSLFADKYPDVKELPQNVWDRYAKGDLDLIEAYDMFNKDSTIQELQDKLAKYESQETIDTKNATNAELSTGSTSGNGQTDSIYTRDQVKKMSKADVKKNYTKIVKDMKTWK